MKVAIEWGTWQAFGLTLPLAVSSYCLMDILLETPGWCNIGESEQKVCTLLTIHDKPICGRLKPLRGQESLNVKHYHPRCDFHFSSCTPVVQSCILNCTPSEKKIIKKTDWSPENSMVKPVFTPSHQLKHSAIHHLWCWKLKRFLGFFVDATCSHWGDISRPSVHKLTFFIKCSFFFVMIE